MRRILARVFLLALFVGAMATVTACKTWAGFGKDVEHMGEKMQPDKDNPDDKGGENGG